MRHAVLAFTAAATLAGLAQPALAQASAADGADVRCVMVLQAVSRDPNQRENAAKGVYFYMGKLSARGALARVEGLMVAEGKRLTTPQLAQTELARCGGELTERSAELQTVNQRLATKFGPPPAKK